MRRRSILSGVVATGLARMVHGTTSVVPSTVARAGGAAASPTAMTDACPAPVSTADAFAVAGLVGWTSEVFRTFVARRPSAGCLSLAVAVIEFVEPTFADAAAPRVVATCRSVLDGPWDASRLGPASEPIAVAGALLAYSGDLRPRDTGAASGDLAVSLAAVSQGRFLRVVLACAAAGSDDALGAGLVVLRATEGRTPSPARVSVDRRGVHVGGLWGLLPTPTDVPHGLEFGGDGERTP